MSEPTSKLSIKSISRIAGFNFLFIVTGYTLSWIFIYSKIIVKGNDSGTLKNILNNELLLRIGIFSDLIIAISSIILAWSLYVILKSFDNNLSILALLLRLLDPFLAIVAVLLSFISIQLLHVENFSSLFNPEQFQSYVVLFLNLHTSASTIPMVFTGLGFILFFYLLYKSKYIPGAISVFGIISYVCILVFSGIKLLHSNAANSMLGNTEMLFYFPSILFELIIGFWLLIKGVNIENE